MNFMYFIMNAKYILQNVAALDALSLNCNFENNRLISVLQIDSFNYGLFVYSVNSYRISFLKLNVKESICHYNADFISTSSTNRTPVTSPIEIYLLNVFSLPFTLLTVICAKRNVWAVGKEAVVNLAPFVDQALVKAKSYESDDAMDVDVIEEFQPNMLSLDITLPISKSEKYNLHFKDMFFGYHFLDSGVIRCKKNLDLLRWELEFLLSSDRMISPDVMALSFLDFPVSYNTSSVSVKSNQGQNDAYKPLIVFIHHSDPESSMFRSLFGINCVSPNVICLIGHPDGKLLWSLCDSSNHFQTSHKLEALFNLKQPIVGIFFVKDIEGLDGCDCMLLVGALGQITFISSKRYPSFIQDSGGYTFWIKTIYISSSISNCDISNNCLLYISNNGALSLINLSAAIHPSDKCEELVSTFPVSEFECIEEMTVADRSKGLIILKTKYGNLYLTLLKKSMESEIVTSSLPSLMNECLKQSNKMQELLNKKALQNRLFATISTFASLKFLKNTLKELMTFSISEINEEPRKYILVINLKCLDNLNLDPELCYVSATAFTYFKNSNCFITKSTPYKADEPTLCLEFTDAALQPPFVSVFPLFVEVGLILQLPEHWKTIDCFDVISSFLPFYIRIQTFMVHELNLLQNNALCFPQSLKFETPNTLKIIKELGMKRPVSNILQLYSKRDFNLLKKFSLCLSLSAAEEMLKNTCESDPCKFIEKLLLGNIFGNSMCKESYLMSKCSPISVNISKNNNHIVITLTANNPESLIGLRIAAMETLLANSRKSIQSTSTSAYINIPSSIYRICEEISKGLMNLYGKDVESEEITHKIISLYKELRTDVSGKLPIL